MLPAFVIGLREGLETVVILGAVVVFTRLRHRSDLLPRIWRACALAAAICVVIGLVIRYVEVNLPWHQQEQFETVVGAVAVATVTYMVIWMSRFPKDLRHNADAAASTSFARGSAHALVLLAFFAVLREGFEITVLVVATIGLTGRDAWLSTGGALLGLAAAVAVGVGVVRGTSSLDVSRFFRITALVLVVSAAGIAMTTVRTANAAGWITFGQHPQLDLSWLAPPGTILSSFTTGMLGLQPNPVLVEVVVWLAYLLSMTALVLWPKRPATAQGHRRTRWIATASVVIVLAVGLPISLSSWSGSSRPAAAAPAAVISASFDGVACATPVHCVAVGGFLPLDKDAANGDPDGDGQATHTLVESSDGVSWTRDPSPDEGQGGARLSGISCPTTTDCVAVGYYRPDPFPVSAKSAPPVFPLIESEHAGRWHIMVAPAVAPDSVLVSVSCPTTADCQSVGYTTIGQADGSAVESSFVERFDGRTWTLVPLPHTAGTSSGLNSVSCPSISTCVAVGETAPADALTSPRPLAEVLDDNVWTPTLLPLYGATSGLLYAISCTAPGRCVAVGNAVTGATTGGPLVLTMSGSSWSLDQTALEQQSDDASLTALGCADVDDCVAAGTFLDSGGMVLTRLDGSGWDPVSRPATVDSIEGISCPTASSCVLVGGAEVDGAGKTSSFVATLTGGHWAVGRSN